MTNLYILGDIGTVYGVDAEELIKSIHSIPSDEKVINLYVNSGGGEVFSSMAITNALLAHSSKVISHVTGLAASAASIIVLGASDEIRMHKASYLMLHEPRANVSGTRNVLIRVASVLESLTNDFIDIYSMRMNDLERSEILSVLEKETYFTADEALQLGLCDVVVNKA